jgi:hypothetical protein
MLLKVPPVRRVIARLVNAEAAMADQQAELGNLGATITEEKAKLGAVDKKIASLNNSLRGLTDGLNEKLARLTDSVRSLREDLSFQRSVVGEIAKHMPPERRAALESQVHALNVMHEQQHGMIAKIAEHMPPDRRTALEAQVHALNSMMLALNARVDRLVAEQARGQLLPEQREALESQAVAFKEIAADTANLKVTLHGRQLQLDAVNSAILANQVNLVELNAAVERLSKTVAASSDLPAIVADLRRENRLLRVGHGATFDELIVARKLSTAEPYRFEDLLAFRGGKSQSGLSVPPLIFIHVPKAGGTTINNFLMKNYKYRADSQGTNFFPRYFPTEFVSLVDPPFTDSDRLRPVFFTGHIGLDNEIFQRMPVRYAVATILREPVSRIISHYRFNSSVPSIFQSAIVDEGLDVIEYFERFRSAIPLQYEYFTTKAEKTSPDRQGQVATALLNLESKVSVFGIQEDFDAFVVLLAKLLGLPNVNFVRLNRTQSVPVTVTTKQAEKLRDLLALDIAFYKAAAKLYRQRKASLPFDVGAEVKSFKAEQKTYSKRRNTVAHQWTRYYS